MAALSTEPYQLGEGDRGVLLLHGFGGSPFELRPLAELLAGAGYRCTAPLLPGHGSDGAHMGEVREEDWRRAATEALDRLIAAGCGRPFVIGFSMGGALAIRLAASRPEDVAGLVLLAPALALHGPSQLFRVLFRYRLLAALWPRIAKGPGDLQDRSVEMPAHPALATRAAAALDEVMRGARRDLPLVEAPTLVIWGAKDRVVPRAAAREAAAGVGSGPAHLVIVPRSAHQLALDYDREAVAAEVLGFLETLRGGSRVAGAEGL